MRELDILYPTHRDELIRRLNKQFLMLELGFDGETYKGKRRGRKPRASKNIETKQNRNMYAPTKRYF